MYTVFFLQACNLAYVHYIACYHQEEKNLPQHLMMLSVVQVSFFSHTHLDKDLIWGRECVCPNAGPLQM